jgi:predicted  nucleic acid-binding Zn-ribbon protein
MIDKKISRAVKGIFLISYLLGLFVLLVTSCNNSHPKEYADGEDTGNVSLAAPDTGHTFSEEMREYRDRINYRLDRLRIEIDSERVELKAERDERKWSEYDKGIRVREERRSELKEKLNELENQSKEDWQKFKINLDDFFTKNKMDNDTISKRNL